MSKNLPFTPSLGVPVDKVLPEETDLFLSVDTLCSYLEKDNLGNNQKLIIKIMICKEIEELDPDLAQKLRMASDVFSVLEDHFRGKGYLIPAEYTAENYNPNLAVG